MAKPKPMTEYRKAKRAVAKPRKPSERPPDLEQAKEWFRIFGQKDDCISATGRRFYRFLLDAIDHKGA
jgi:hypothetical protein